MKLSIISPALTFRKDIEILRGLAVLLVMLYHFNALGVTGGYIGVDIFFVISGFLIASIISSAVDKERFSFFDFYNKRVKRLMPALVLVTVVCSLIFSVFLLPKDLIGLLKSDIKIFTLNSNLYYLNTLQDYFAAESDGMAFLHTWSLSVEWQFYLVFPPVFYVMCSRLSLLRCAQLVFFLTLVAVVVSELLSRGGREAYLTFTPRLFEFLLGASAAFIRVETEKYANTIKYFCFGLLTLLAFTYDDNTVFPGLNAFYVGLLTALYLVVKEQGRLIVERALLLPGKLSYSAYLWHWPMVAAAFHLGVDFPSYAFVPLAALTFTLAYLTFVCIEDPLRKSKFSFLKTLVVYLLVPLLLFAAAYTAVRKNDGYPQRLGGEFSRSFETLKKYEHPLRDRCHQFSGDDISTCEFGADNGSEKALLIGDSHASHYWSFVDALAVDANLSVLGQTDSSCFLSEVFAQNESCQQFATYALNLIDEKSWKYVIVGQRWAGYGPNFRDKSGGLIDYWQAIMPLLERVRTSGSIPVLLLPVAEDGEDSKQCFYAKLRLGQSLGMCNIRTNDYEAKQLAMLKSLFDRVREEYPETILIDPKKLQCEQGVCITASSIAPFYSDSNHINDYGGAWLAEKMLSTAGNPLASQGNIIKH